MRAQRSYFIHWPSLSLWRITLDPGGTSGSWTTYPSTTAEPLFGRKRFRKWLKATGPKHP